MCAWPGQAMNLNHEYSFTVLPQRGTSKSSLYSLLHGRLLLRWLLHRWRWGSSHRWRWGSSLLHRLCLHLLHRWGWSWGCSLHRLHSPLLASGRSNASLRRLQANATSQHLLQRELRSVEASWQLRGSQAANSNELILASRLVSVLHGALVNASRVKDTANGPASHSLLSDGVHHCRRR